jgi:N-acylethanolamine-hydrolysing acid amidase
MYEMELALVVVTVCHVCDPKTLRAGLPMGRDNSRPLSATLPEDTSLPIIHGRNMDESPRAGRNMTLNITVTRGGAPLYHIFDWTWITTGTYTASRKGGVTLEENWNNDGSQSLEQILTRVQQPDFTPVAFLFRNVQESLMSFDAAATYLLNATLASPAYIIMSGPGRVGHVLTLMFNKSGNVKETIDDTSAVSYMVQTNYDRWKPDPPTDPRRTVAQDALAMVGRHRSGTELGVWMALGTYPVHNPHTMFSVLMSVDQIPEGYVRRAMIPDPLP